MPPLSRRALLAGTAGTPLVAGIGPDSAADGDPLLTWEVGWRKALAAARARTEERQRIGDALVRRIGSPWNASGCPEQWDAAAEACGLADAERREDAAWTIIDRLSADSEGLRATSVAGALVKLDALRVMAESHGGVDNSWLLRILAGIVGDLRRIGGATGRTQGCGGPSPAKRQDSAHLGFEKKRQPSEADSPSPLAGEGLG